MWFRNASFTCHKIFRAKKGRVVSKFSQDMANGRTGNPMRKTLTKVLILFLSGALMLSVRKNKV
jgi:hypothetical protein